MSKINEQNNKLKRSIYISLALHVVLIAILLISSINEHQEVSAGGNGNSVEAVIVDTETGIGQEVNTPRLNENIQAADSQQDTASSVKEQTNPDSTVSESQTENTQKQAAEQAKAEALAKQAAEQAKAEALAKQAAEQAQAEAAAKAKAEAAAKAEAEAAAKAKAEAAAKAKAEAAAKAKAREAAKKQAEMKAKEDKTLDDLLNGLTTGKKAMAAKSSAAGAAAGSGVSHKAGASEAAIQSYIGQIQSVIQSKFYDSSNYSGKVCDVAINIAPDGLLLTADAVAGDNALCQAAINAARQAHFPKPPSPEVWEAVKNATLEFKP